MGKAANSVTNAGSLADLYTATSTLNPYMYFLLAVLRSILLRFELKR